MKSELKCVHFYVLSHLRNDRHYSEGKVTGLNLKSNYVTEMSCDFKELVVLL